VYNKILCRTDLLIIHETLYISSSDYSIIRVIVQQLTSMHRLSLIPPADHRALTILVMCNNDLRLYLY